MANPKVFISSTCYDLGEIRDNLFSFIESYCYESVLSEKGDVFFHPSLHTHESCVNEVSNCQLFILIIGGRYGGSYKIDPTKSIVNAEYFAAKKLNIPIFTFVKRDVYEDHRVYQKNKSNTILKKIIFPSIDDQKNATHIFEFINEVRLSEINNGLFHFEYAKDIRHLLGKQLAGMFYDFLIDRQKESEKVAVKSLLDNLTLISKKSEEIIENIYKKVDEPAAQKVIDSLDKEITAEKFFKSVLKLFSFDGFTGLSTNEFVELKTTGITFFEFLKSTKNFVITKEDDDNILDRLGLEDTSQVRLIDCIEGGAFTFFPEGDRWIGFNSRTTKIFNQLSEYFQYYSELSKEQKTELVENYLIND